MPGDSEKETILKYTQFMAPSKGNVYQQVWFCVLTDKRLLFYAVKGGGRGSSYGAVIGAGIGLAIGSVISLIVISQTNPHGLTDFGADFGMKLATWGLPLAVIGLIIGVKKGALSASGGVPHKIPDAESLESALRDSLEHYEFPRPTLPDYKERSPFMGGVTIKLGKLRRFSFAHEPGYSEIKGILELIKKEEDRKR